MSIADKLLKAFDTHANSIVISEGENSISYRALQTQCLKVASHLKKCNLANAFVAIEVDNIIDHIVAMLGVLISGNCYVSVTPENQSFVAGSGLPIALSITSADSDQGICLYDILKDEQVSSGFITPQIDGQMNMCAFFTSGSTGQSKVIVHQHKNILNDTLRQIVDNEVTQADKIDLVFSLSFSASLACIYPALLTGAQLCIFDLKTEGLTNVANFWEQKGITFSTLSVSSFQGICKTHPSLHHLQALRFISISAEPVKDTTIRLFQTTFGPAVNLQIAYASTETRTISEMKITNDGQPILFADAIGKPVSDKVVHIADIDGNYLPVGQTGEIIVESPYIANAYYNQPEESKQSFIVEGDVVYYKTGDLGRFNNEGYLFYQGRLKNEHKLNGVKINLLDIEQQIEKVPGILKVAVVINQSDPEQPKLACFYETDGTCFTNGNIIKRVISDGLPASHIPHLYIVFNKIPLTHTGKTDRKKLEFFDVKANSEPTELSSAVAAADNTAQVIIDVFKKILRTNDVGADTDFFDAGGDSLSSLFCIADIESSLKVTLNVTTLIANPTPKKLSNYLQQQHASLQVFVKTYLNEYVDGRQNLYFIGHGKSESYEPLINSALRSNFNLIAIIYDLYGGGGIVDYPKFVLDQLTQEIANYSNSIIIGYSFSGFMAHQLACVIPNISHCVLLDTYNYFEYEKYASRPQNHLTVAANICWHFFCNRDFGYPLYFLRRRRETKILKKQQKDKTGQGEADSRNKKEKHQLFIDKVNYFTSILPYQTTLNNCIYFQASRYKRNIGKSWGLKVGGKFYYKKLFCTHADIMQTKHAQMASYIIKAAKV